MYVFRMGHAEGIDIFYFPASFDSASKILAASFALSFSAERVFHRRRRSFTSVVVLSGRGLSHTNNSFFSVPFLT